MSAAIKLTLKTSGGDFVFAGAEVPERITFGGDQMLCTHKMVGGLRVIDTMGADDAPLAWSGWFLGSSANGADLPDSKSATGRARFLDYVRRSGQMCTLTWGDFSYQVVVSRFTADFEKPYKVPFQITCEVLVDQTKDVTSTAPASPTDAIKQDSATLSALTAAVGIPSLSSAVSSATSALSSVVGAAAPIAGGLVSLGGGSGSGIASAVTSAVSGAVSSSIGGALSSALGGVTSALSGAIASAQGALASVQGAVSGLVASAESAVASIPSIGGLNPLQSIASQATAMAAQATASMQLSTLTTIASVTTRLQSNLALVASPGGNKQVTTGGGNLFSVATQAYGDATRWSDIAQASGLSDPMTTGFNNLTIPS